MEQYTVTGMSCAACSTRVEKAVSKVPGVTSCSVSLLTNSMGVEGTASEQDIVKAVTDAGYGASKKGSKAAENTKNGSSAAGSSAFWTKSSTAHRAAFPVKAREFRRSRMSKNSSLVAAIFVPDENAGFTKEIPKRYRGL